MFKGDFLFVKKRRLHYFVGLPMAWQLCMYINGEWLKTDQQFSVTNPATGDVIDRVPDGDQSHAKLAIDAASAAYKLMVQRDCLCRGPRCCKKPTSLMIERKQVLAELLTSEQGKPLKAALNEVQYAADFLRWFAEEAKRVYGETIPSARARSAFYCALSAAWSGGRSNAMELPNFNDYT